MIINDPDQLVFLLGLNLACAAKENAREKVRPPGLPLLPKEHTAFVTDNYIPPPAI